MRAFVPALLVSFLSAASAVRFGAASGLTLKAPSPAVGDAPPDFCRGLACPKYTTVNSSETWELREYAPADWVSTKVVGISYDKALSTGFAVLFGYITGTNADSAKVDMTAPVKTHVHAGLGPNCGDEFTVSFFVDPDAPPPPNPAAAGVFLASEPAKKYYVATYSGWSSEQTVMNAVRQLAAELEAAGEPIDEDAGFETAGYDSPFRIFNRHNEVWLPAKA